MTQSVATVWAVRRSYGLNPEDVMNLRFAATEFPAPTGQITTDVERLSQWFVEIAFVRDFVYRNPEKTTGKEFSDLLILFDDTAIVVQIKTRTGTRDTEPWVSNNLNHALKQLNGSVRALREKHVTSFRNELLDINVPFDLSTFKCIYGIVVLAFPGGPTDYEDLIEAGNTPAVDTNILSLDDLVHVCRRMSTAADFIVYLELRHALSEKKRLLLNDESRTMDLLSAELPGLMHFRGNEDQGKRSRSIQGFRRLLLGSILEDPDYRFGFLIDDIIAHSHDVDPAFSPNPNPLETLNISQCLGYLTRERRILLGKHMFLRAQKATKGSPRLFVHFQRIVGQLYLFLYTGVERRKRQEWLRALAEAAPYRYSCLKVLGVATEPIGAGRSYDLCFIVKTPPLAKVVLPPEISDILPPLAVDLFERHEDEELHKTLDKLQKKSANEGGT